VSIFELLLYLALSSERKEAASNLLGIQADLVYLFCKVSNFILSMALFTLLLPRVVLKALQMGGEYFLGRLVNCKIELRVVLKAPSWAGCVICFLLTVIEAFRVVFLLSVHVLHRSVGPNSYNSCAP